ncbi:MAG: hypothetical protein R3F11_26645 [Verrucomicrobiales bacterium]
MMVLSSLRGYWNYFGVIRNFGMAWRYHAAGMRLAFGWHNRRSQRRRFGWGKFARLWNGEWKIPPPVCDEGKLPMSRA